MVLDPRTGRSDLLVDLDMQITFRSTEGLIRFLGDYLHSQEVKGRPAETYRLGSRPLFSVATNSPGPDVVSVQLLRKHYSIIADDNLRENMQVLAIVEQLVNLQKSNADKPTTLPVQVIP